MTRPFNVEFRVYLALGTSEATSLWDTATWDTSTWGGSDPEWTEVTQWVRSFTTRRGAARFDDKIRTGVARVVFDNAEGRFNPDYGLEELPGAMVLRPGRWIRIVSKIAGDTNETWTGYVDSLFESYIGAGEDSLMTVQCFDFASLLAMHNPPAAASQGAGETTGSRVERVLDDYGWLWQDVDTGDHTMLATTLAQNYLEECQRAALAEGGAFYFEGVTATFRDSDWPAETTVTAQIGLQDLTSMSWTSPEGHTVTANGDPHLVGGDAPIGISAAVPEWSAQNIRNDIQVAADGGTTYRKTDTTSWALYGRRTWPVGGPATYQLDNDTDVQAVGQKLLDAYAYDYPRLTSVTCHPTTEAGAQSLLALTLGDLVEVNVALRFLGWNYTVEAHVLGVEYAATPDDYAVLLRLDQSTRGNPTT